MKPSLGVSPAAAYGFGGRSRGRRTNWLDLIARVSVIACVFTPLAPRCQELASHRSIGEFEQVFNNACRTCHAIREGDHRLGPSLHGVLGRRAGTLSGYPYSSAMNNAGFVWDEQTLEHFIADPDEVVPGNNMRPYGGLTSAEERAKIIAFLRMLTAREP